MSKLDEAYQAARQLIFEAKQTEQALLSFDRYETRLLDALPPEIVELGGLRRLELLNTRISDLAPLAGLTSLRELWLDGTRVADLSPLAFTEGLTWLSLENTGVSDLSPLAGLNSLEKLWLDGTNVTDLAPLAKLSRLAWLSLENTRVSDLSPLSNLKALAELWLSRSSVRELRPLYALRETLTPSEGASKLHRGVNFTDTVATQIDPSLEKISALKNDRQRNLFLFKYLEDGRPPEGLDLVEPEPIAFLPVLVEEGRLEISASLPTEAERDEQLKRVLHQRLGIKARELAQTAGNRFPRLSARARALARELEKPFEALNILLIHLEVDDLASSHARGAERTGEEEFSPDVVDALSDVARIGPGLTLDHSDVELLEERKRRYAADPPAWDEKAAHDQLSLAAAEDEAAIGENLRRLEGEIAGRPDSVAAGAVQVAVHRNMLIRIARSVIVDGKTVVLGALGSCLYGFVLENWPAVNAVAASYGPGFLEWFLAALSQVTELAGVVANVEIRPIDNRRKG